jgi:hypothetical protein
MTGVKPVIYEKYEHFVVVYEIFSVYFYNFDREGLGGAKVYVFYFILKQRY